MVVKQSAILGLSRYFSEFHDGNSQLCEEIDIKIPIADAIEGLIPKEPAVSMETECVHNAARVDAVWLICHDETCYSYTVVWVDWLLEVQVRKPSSHNALMLGTGWV